jgi:outer membrane protein TolC
MARLFFLFLLLLFFAFSCQLYGQEQLSLQEYIGYVKRYHPFVKQANIELSESQAKLLKARGAFDPELSLDLKEKTVKDISYYERFNAAFSLPTPLGISLKAALSEAEGVLLNPENTVSGEQLYALGADIDLGKGLLANPRTIALKQAKRFVQQAEEENRLQINSILEQATHAFLDWYAAYQQWQVIGEFVENASFRFEGVKKRVLVGDLAPIDSIEARIAYNSRVLMQEKSHLKLKATALKASNFLWLDEQPLEIKETLRPFLDESTFALDFTPLEIPIEEHPKIKALGYKVDQGRLERQLQRNNLLPDVTLSYRWLSAQDPLQQWQAALDPQNNTTALKVKFSVLLMKERAELKLASLKLDELTLALEQAKLDLKNKLEALKFTANSLFDQAVLAQNMTTDCRMLFKGEQKKFEAGESSLFLVNSREAKFLDAAQKSIELEQNQCKAQLSYYYSLNFY